MPPSVVAVKFASVTSLPEVTVAQFNPFDGLQFAAGSSSGHVLLYDLRSSQPLVTKDHQYGFPIRTVAYHESGNVLSCDKKIVKIWDKDTVRRPDTLDRGAIAGANAVHAGCDVCDARRASCSHPWSRRRTSTSSQRTARRACCYWAKRSRAGTRTTFPRSARRPSGPRSWTTLRYIGAQ